MIKKYIATRCKTINPIKGAMLSVGTSLSLSAIFTCFSRELRCEATNAVVLARSGVVMTLLSSFYSKFNVFVKREGVTSWVGGYVEGGYVGGGGYVVGGGGLLDVGYVEGVRWGKGVRWRGGGG